jgi:hypothetical protein
MERQEFMDISSLKNQYESLYREINDKAEIVKKLGGDNPVADTGDIYVKDSALPGDEHKVYTGRIVLNPGDGSVQTADIEEKSADGSTARYQLERSTSDDITKSSLLKKTDTQKMKAVTVEKPSSSPEVVLEEMQFVEAALVPEIDSKSEHLKAAVLEAARTVEKPGNAECETGTAPGETIVKDAVLSMADGESLHLSGKVVKDPASGEYSMIDLMGTREKKHPMEFYYTKSKDYDFYKKADETAMESTQIFEQGGPKLVLFSQTNRFSL